MLALPVHVHQQLSYLLQRGQVDHAPVDSRHGAPGGVDLAGDDHGIVAAVLAVGQAALDQYGAQSRLRRGVHSAEVELPLHAGGGSAVAHELRPDLGAEDRAEGVNDDRLARARLARERVEARPQAQIEVVYDSEVGDVEFSKHM